MIQSYRANGKLLLTGEYTILDGALGLALPTEKGQTLEVHKTEDNLLYWESYDENQQLWYQNSFEIDRKKIIPSQDKQTDITNRLVQLFEACLEINPDINYFLKGKQCKTLLEFNRDWGLGSSSTLISLVAQWTQLNPYELLSKTFGGSGYDIACATVKQPILFKIKDFKPEIKTTTFKPEFKSQLFFIYLNQKQDSRLGIAHYKSTNSKSTYLIEKISALTNAILNCDNASLFSSLLEEHEDIIAQCTNQTTVKKRLFSDFNGSIKSLGAWGGDFVLAICKNNPEAYFKSKGYHTIIPYEQMIL